MTGVPEESGEFRIAGGVIDRSRSLPFQFDGALFTGHLGDTLASALLAHGMRVVGRSFKYHRPRGILSAGVEEPNALVTLRREARREPNTRATVTELYEGLVAESQNRWPSLGFDVLAVNGLAGSLFSAGFYYKTFMWPGPFWERLYEPIIRRAAGLGKASLRSDPDRYEKATAHCDVLVIGAGPAGLAAALAAGRAGARVILAEDDFALGGRLLAERVSVDGQSGPAWVARAEQELASLSNVRIFKRTSVFGVYDHGTYGAVERVGDPFVEPPPFAPRQRSWRIVAKRAVLAAGAFERPLAFSNNDRPGVMLAAAVRSYLNRFAVAPGRRAVVATSGDDGWRTAHDLVAAGVLVEAVVDTRRDGVTPAGGWRVIRGSVIDTEARARVVDAVRVRGHDGREETIACDLLAVSNGWNPAIHLTCHLSGRPVWDENLQSFVPGDCPRGMAVAGAAAGRFDLAAALAEGARLGAEAARDAGFDRPSIAVEPQIAGDSGPGTAEPVWRMGANPGKTFVDFQNDVTVADIELAHREGYGAVEHVKRYTTLGMGTDQGKTANVAAIAIAAELAGRPIAELGTTVFRPPFAPIALGALAGFHRGRDFRPVRHVPSHAWAAANGAVFAEAGLWLRAQYFRRSGEVGWRESVDREVLAVRTAAGLCDVSTLGKITVAGPDAALFLDRVYANTMSTLGSGRVRYGLMLREDGFVLDDGTVARLADRLFVLTTTTAQAERVRQHLDYCRQVLWPELELAIVGETEQWAQFALAGPRSRDILEKVVSRRRAVSDKALPHMGCTEIAVRGVTARLFRVSFSGERAYEIAVPADFGASLFEALIEAGGEFGIAAYGTEALNVLRIEKGHASGPEIDGRSTARDLGLGGLLSTKKDFVGRVMAGRAVLAAEERPTLVGLRAVSGDSLSAGAALVAVGRDAVAANAEGHVSSVAYSPMLGGDIALGLLRRGASRHGETVRAVDLLRGREAPCEVVDPVFLDREGAWVRG